MRWIGLLVVALLLVLWRTPVSNAATGPGCELYTYQEDARRDFNLTAKQYPDLLGMYAENMDPDGNGIVCEELPALPEILADTTSIRGSFIESDEFMFTIRGADYSVFYELRLSGISFSDGNCTDFLSDAKLNAYIVPEDQKVHTLHFKPTEQADNASDTSVVGAMVWSPSPNPNEPSLLNEWVLLNGLAEFDPMSAHDEWSDQLEAAEKLAKENGVGIWGDCQLPEPDDDPTSLNPYSPLFEANGNGDQVAPFSIDTEGTYVLTLDVAVSDAVFVSVDVHGIDGTSYPALSIVTGTSGQFSSASYLTPGDYYVQVTAVGAWKVNIEPISVP